MSPRNQSLPFYSHLIVAVSFFIRWAVLLVFCFYILSLSRSRWCEAQWDGDSANSRRFHVHIWIVFSVACLHSLDWDVISCCKEPEKEQSNREGRSGLHTLKREQQDGNSHQRRFLFFAIWHCFCTLHYSIFLPSWSSSLSIRATCV